ncbi:MAG: enoyl-CoA hydratase-related protein [Chloroflexi bacterium]|nr:enoyl-CoA hydratase-related protein [Chloroflexota bacterium]
MPNIFEKRDLKILDKRCPNMSPGRTMELHHILYEQSGKIGRITLNRPDYRNAINMAMLYEIRSVFQRLDWDNEVRVIIIRGAGQGFSSGYDLDDLAESEEMDPLQDVMRNSTVLGIYNGIRNCKMATIAQIHGFCLNGATDLAHHVDFTIVSKDCEIGYPTLRCWGADMANMWLYHMGPQWAKYLMMTGDTIDGEMAEKIGFAIKSVTSEKLESTVLHVAERLANVHKEMLAAHKGIVNHGLDLMGLVALQRYAVTSDSVTNQSDVVRKVFDRTLGLGVKALLKIMNEGFKPQKAPFEPLDE